MKQSKLSNLLLLTFLGLVIPMIVHAQSIAERNDDPITESSGTLDGDWGGRDEEWFSTQSVDLGLSVKWGTCNLGAHKSYEVGYYYAWGETEPKSSYTWETYKHCDGTDESLTKYGWNSSMGIVDNIRQLEAADDAATVKLGADAHIPTEAEWQELLDNTTAVRATLEDVSGWLFTSKKNGKSIFFPNGSRKSDPNIDDYYKDQVYCWASTNYNCWGSNGQMMNASGSSASVSSISRACGLNIRPVFNPDKLSVSVDTLRFGTLAPGSSASRTIRVTNNSEEVIAYTVSRVSGYSMVGNSFHFEGEISGASELYNINPGESATYTFVYAPEHDSQGDDDYAKYCIEVYGSNEKHEIFLIGRCVEGEALDADEENSLVVWHKDGSKVMFCLDDKPKVIFFDDMVKVKSASLFAEYEFASIRKMTYGKNFADNIRNIEKENERPFEALGKKMVFIPNNKDLHVMVVSINGIVAKEFVVKKDEPVSYSFDNLENGVYIVIVNGVSYKINLR